MLNRKIAPFIAAGMLFLAPSVASAALIFNVTNQGGATPQMMTGFAQACAMWSAVLNDSVSINIGLKAAVLTPGQIAGTNAFYDPYPYADVRNALLAGAQSNNDLSSAANLQAGSVFSMLINRTANNPNGVASATPYFDTGLGGAGQAGAQNNNTVRITSANAKALGLYPDVPGSDGTITFSTLQSYDYDRSNGINASQVDFVGAAVHEIGHLLGFYSGVETLDGNGGAPGLNDNQLRFVTPIDLFRFSSRSIGAGGGVGIIDWTADGHDKYFSVDGGVSSLGLFSNGSDYGDGFDAGHWKSGLSLGIMNPSAGVGDLLTISSLDLQAFDVIGYELTAVPEPSTLTMVGMIVLLKGAVTCRRRSKSKTPT